MTTANTARSDDSSYEIEAVKKTLLETSKEITGTIESISGNTLTVNADIADISKITRINPIGDGFEAADTNPKIKKIFTVATNGQTQYYIQKLDEMKVGQSIKVISKEPIYQNTELTAIGILCSARYEDKKDAILKITKIIGNVKQISEDTIIITAAVPDIEKINPDKDYQREPAPTSTKDLIFKITDKTEFTANKQDSIKEKDPVMITSDEDVSQSKNLTAVKIESPPIK